MELKLVVYSHEPSGGSTLSTHKWVINTRRRLLNPKQFHWDSGQNVPSILLSSQLEEVKLFIFIGLRRFRRLRKAFKRKMVT